MRKDEPGGFQGNACLQRRKLAEAFFVSVSLSREIPSGTLGKLDGENVNKY